MKLLLSLFFLSRLRRRAHARFFSPQAQIKSVSTMHIHCENTNHLNHHRLFFLRVRSSVDLNAQLKLKDTRAALDVREESEFGIKPSPSVIARERCAC